MQDTSSTNQPPNNNDGNNNNNNNNYYTLYDPEQGHPMYYLKKWIKYNRLNLQQYNNLDCKKFVSVYSIKRTFNFYPFKRKNKNKS